MYLSVEPYTEKKICFDFTEYLRVHLTCSHNCLFSFLERLEIQGEGRKLKTIKRESLKGTKIMNFNIF